jgi:hypothetical protein
MPSSLIASEYVNSSTPGDHTLWSFLEKVPDPRKPRGVRYPLVALLALSAAAVVAGSRSFQAIGEWIKDLEETELAEFGLTRAPGGVEPEQAVRPSQHPSPGRGPGGLRVHPYAPPGRPRGDCSGRQDSARRPGGCRSNPTSSQPSTTTAVLSSGRRPRMRSPMRSPAVRDVFNGLRP